MTVGSIKVFNSSDPTLQWQRPLQNEAEYEDAKERCLYTRSVSIIQGCLFPARTNNVRNFVEDFFFPNLCHNASQVDSCARKILENLVIFLLDLISFPIRILTCIPRAIYNAQQKEHPLLKYLKQQNAPIELTKADRVQVKLKVLFGAESQREPTLFFDNGAAIKTTRESGKLTVHFAEIPKAIIDSGIWKSHYN